MPFEHSYFNFILILVLWLLVVRLEQAACVAVWLCWSGADVTFCFAVVAENQSPAGSVKPSRQERKSGSIMARPQSSIDRRVSSSFMVSSLLRNGCIGRPCLCVVTDSTDILTTLANHGHVCVISSLPIRLTSYVILTRRLICPSTTSKQFYEATLPMFFALNAFTVDQIPESAATPESYLGITGK